MSKVVRATIGLIIVTMLGKVLGFLRELILASSYGASMYSDAYITALNIPMVLFVSIGNTIGTVLIPMYYEVNDDSNDKKSLKFINNVFNIVILLCIILGIVSLFFVEPLVKMFAIGFKGEVLSIAVKFTRISILTIVFIGASYVIRAYLQIKGNFNISGISTVPRNIIIIISIILSTKYSPYLMIWGALLGFILEFIFLLPYAIKLGYKYDTYLKIGDPYIKKMIWLILPVLIGVAVNQVNTVIDRTLASTLVEGSISALNYASKLNNFVMAIFIASVGTVIYPMLSRLSDDENNDMFIDTVSTSVNSVILLVVPISVGAMILSTPIVKLLFERGQFNTTATHMTSIALSMYSLGMVAYGLRDILGKVFYSIQDTKTPMINGSISMVINIILNFIFIKYFKIAGLALATSLSSIICIFLLFNSLGKKIGYYGQDQIIKTTLKCILSSLFMGVVTYFTYYVLNNLLGSGFIYDCIKLITSIFIGALTYAISISVLKVKEIEKIKEKLKVKVLKINLN